LGVLDQVLVFKLRRIRNLLTDAFRSSSTEGKGLRAGEFGILALIEANPGISQRDLARTGGLDETMLVGILDDLEAHGWAVRSSHRDDRRRHVLDITKKGRVKLRELLEQARANEAPARSALSPQEMQTFEELLEKIYRALF
jgi:DNA-binding MarR family transcriptional regulator